MCWKTAAAKPLGAVAEQSPVRQAHYDAVLTCGEIPLAVLAELFGRYGMRLAWVDDHLPIPGSYWGESEAGLVADRLYVRRDTPVHSALHEACHYICMDRARRAHLHTDAGGDCDEENAVNYLQILLADWIPACGRERMFADMDAWGYSFRLGSARAWFDQDAEDARQWLLRHAIIDDHERPTWQLRWAEPSGSGVSAAMVSAETQTPKT